MVRVKRIPRRHTHANNPPNNNVRNHGVQTLSRRMKPYKPPAYLITAAQRLRKDVERVKQEQRRKGKAGRVVNSSIASNRTIRKLALNVLAAASKAAVALKTKSTTFIKDKRTQLLFKYIQGAQMAYSIYGACAATTSHIPPFMRNLPLIRNIPTLPFPQGGAARAVDLAFLTAHAGILCGKDAFNWVDGVGLAWTLSKMVFSVIKHYETTPAQTPYDVALKQVNTKIRTGDAKGKNNWKAVQNAVERELAMESNNILSRTLTRKRKAESPTRWTRATVFS